MSSALSVAIQPDERLRPLLTRDYLRFRQPAEDAAAWLAPPSAAVTVIINLGEAFGGLPEAFVAGPTDECGVVAMDGAIECVELKLTPLGAYRLFGVPVSELTNEVADLTDLTGLADLRPGSLDEGLLRLACAGPEPAGEVEWVWRRLHAAHGNVRIAVLAAEVGWSRRHLVDRFRAQTGLPPKTLARVLRFEELLRRLPGGDLAEVAAACGYYDQAHMNRDFREFAGTTPGAWLARFPSVQYPWVPAS